MAPAKYERNTQQLAIVLMIEETCLNIRSGKIAWMNISRGAIFVGGNVAKHILCEYCIDRMWCVVEQEDIFRMIPNHINAMNPQKIHLSVWDSIASNINVSSKI